MYLQDECAVIFTMSLWKVKIFQLQNVFFLIKFSEGGRAGFCHGKSSFPSPCGEKHIRLDHSVCIYVWVNYIYKGLEADTILISWD
jgi:hypothetical protein